MELEQHHQAAWLPHWAVEASQNAAKSAEEVWRVHGKPAVHRGIELAKVWASGVGWVASGWVAGGLVLLVVAFERAPGCQHVAHARCGASTCGWYGARRPL